VTTPEPRYAPAAAGEGLAGLAYYLSDQIPAGMDTDTHLGKRHRRVLADGQLPVAVQRNRGPGRSWIPLYLVAAAVPMPLLTPAQQARWDEVRLCSRCRELQLDPCPVNRRTGKRICGRAKCWAAEPATAVAEAMNSGELQAELRQVTGG